jgi:hypothetical protein
VYWCGDRQAREDHWWASRSVLMTALDASMAGEDNYCDYANPRGVAVLLPDKGLELTGRSFQRTRSYGIPVWAGLTRPNRSYRWSITIPPSVARRTRRTAACLAIFAMPLRMACTPERTATRILGEANSGRPE